MWELYTDQRQKCQSNDEIRQPVRSRRQSATDRPYIEWKQLALHPGNVTKSQSVGGHIYHDAYQDDNRGSLRWH